MVLADLDPELRPVDRTLDQAQSRGSDELVHPLTALFVVLALVRRAPMAAGPGQAPNASYQRDDPSAHQRYALTGAPKASLAQSPASRASVKRYLDARVNAGFRVDLVKPIDRQPSHGFDASSHRDPRRRCGGVFAPDGRG